MTPYTLLPPRGRPVPVVFDSPHSGRDYPADFRAALPPEDLRLSEDRYVDRLYAPAPELGATLLLAHFPRCYIDANRKPEDIDPDLLAEPWPVPLRPGAKTGLGKGLIWRLVRPGVAIYDRKLTVAEVLARLEHCWLPYHTALSATLDRTHARFGRVYHVNCHSMPARSDALAPEGPGFDRPDFVLSDGDGATCSAAFTDFVRLQLEGMGYHVAVNTPYRGAELIHRYSNPAAQRHSLQIEVNRRHYLTETLEPSAGFPKLAADLRRLAEAVCGDAPLW